MALFPVTKVVNIKTDKYDVLIDRKTKWGNPFTHITDRQTLAKFIVETREESIKKYDEYLEQQIETGIITIDELLSLEGKVLGCHCKPKSCHGDIIVNKIQKYKNLIDRK